MECKCRFDGKKNVIQINRGIAINVNVIVKKFICVKKIMFGIQIMLATCNCEHGKYLARIMEDSEITCDEVIKSYDEEMKTIPANFNEKKVTCKTKNLYT